MILGRMMGIDYGEARVGVAISDALGVTARGIETIQCKNQDNSYIVSKLQKLIKDYEIKKIIMGLPLRTDGTKGDSALNAEALAKAIEEETGIEVILKDERFTTVIANRILRTSPKKRGASQRKVIDQVAAEIILQDYLNGIKTMI